MVGHARGVGRHDADRDAERPFGRLPPAGVDHAVGVVLAHALGVGAVAAVDGDSRADRHESEHVVALDRVAAFGQLVLDFRDVVVDHQRVLRSGLLLRSVQRGLLAFDFGGRGAALLFGFARKVA